MQDSLNLYQLYLSVADYMQNKISLLCNDYSNILNLQIDIAFVSKDEQTRTISLFIVEIYQEQNLSVQIHRRLQSLLWMIDFQFFWSPPVPFQQCQPYRYLTWNKQRKFAIIGILIIKPAS